MTPIDEAIIRKKRLSRIRLEIVETGDVDALALRCADSDRERVAKRRAEQIRRAQSAARPREGGDPVGNLDHGIPAFAGMSGLLIKS
jgi:hypothetical protein